MFGEGMPMSSYIIPFVLLAIYFFPTWMAGHRQHQSTGGIFVLNLLLGWTVLGWIAALIWACSAVMPTGDAHASETHEQAAQRVVPGWVRKRH